MTRSLRGILGLTLLVAAAIVPVLAVQPPAVAVSTDANTLSVGEVLRPSPDPQLSELTATNAKFRFAIYYDTGAPSGGVVALEIDQEDPVVVAGLWNRGAHGTTAGFATMQANGNFVLYAKPGFPIWSTGTAGTGSDNRLVMQDDGNLVMYTATGHKVWASGTHREVLPENQKLMPGEHLTNGHSETEPPTTLTMQHDGDLVLRYAGAVLWASNTTVPGSYLLMRSDGDLLIQSGSNFLWDAHLTNFNPEHQQAWLDVDMFGRFVVDYSALDTTGGGNYTKFDSTRAPGETGRVGGGALRFMTPASTLHTNQSLGSSNGFRLTMQGNGNLVLRGPGGAVLWQTRTAGHPGAFAKLTRRGDLVVYGNGHTLWRTATYGTMTVVVDPHGKVVSSDREGHVLWTSAG